MKEITNIKKVTVKNINKKLAFKSVSVIYKSIRDTYRGFVMPYAVTYEGTTQKEVKDVLSAMVEQYELGLERYGHPEHLKSVPLTDEEDKEKLNAISPELLTGLSREHRLIVRPGYYAEAKLPA